MPRPKRLQRSNETCKKSGYFSMHYPNGSKYVGDFKDNLRHGKGSYITRNGIIYDGHWVEGSFEGWGSIRYQNSRGCWVRKYIGQFRNWKRHGEGKQFDEDGTYEGCWADGVKNGLGIKWFKDGRIYLGRWRNDEFNGIGTLVYSNGNHFEGNWKNGLRHGEGSLYDTNHGQVKKGIWVKDICKASIMQDYLRSEAKYPTSFPIPKLEISNPCSIVASAFNKYLIDINKGC